MTVVRILWEGAILSFVVVLLLVSGYLYQASVDPAPLTGQPILIGGVAPQPNATTSPDPQDTDFRERYRDDLDHETVKCLMLGGVREEDVLVLGHLLRGMTCQPQASHPDVQFEDGCLVVRAQQGLVSALCLGPEQPLFYVRIDEGALPPELASSQNYNGLLLFLVFVSVVFLGWRELELRESKKEERTRRAGLDTSPLDKKTPEENKKVVYMKAAPLFKDVERVEKRNLTDEEIKKVHEKFVQEELEAKRQMQYEKMKQDDVAVCITQFNDLAREIVDGIRRQELDEARRQYLLLFPLYTRVYSSVDYGTRADLESVLSYLNVQIKVFEKSRMISELIEKTYRESETRKASLLREEQERMRKEEVKKAQKTLEKAQRSQTPRDVLDEIDAVHEHVTKGTYGTPSAQTARDLNRELTELRELLERGARDKEALGKYAALFKKPRKDI